jgi:hypothetical protein
MVRWSVRKWLAWCGDQDLSQGESMLPESYCYCSLPHCSLL